MINLKNNNGTSPKSIRYPFDLSEIDVKLPALLSLITFECNVTDNNYEALGVFYLGKNVRFCRKDKQRFAPIRIERFDNPCGMCWNDRVERRGLYCDASRGIHRWCSSHHY